MANEELLRRVVKRIERDQNWDQDYWGSVDEFVADNLEVSPVVSKDGHQNWLEVKDSSITEENLCRTAFCLAGHTILEAGDVLLVSRDGLDATFCLDDTGAFRTIEQRARELLELTEEEADYLFMPTAGGGDLDMFKQEITEVTGVELD